MSDLPPLPEGFVVESDYDPMKDILSAGIDFTNGYRTPEDIQRLKAEGYSPAPHSKHLEGDAIDLVPGKSGKSLADVRAEADSILSKWSAGGKVIDEGDHIHLQLNGWGQAPGTPGTPYSGMPDLPDGFQLEQRGPVSKESIAQPQATPPLPDSDPTEKRVGGFADEMPGLPAKAQQFHDQLYQAAKNGQIKSVDDAIAWADQFNKANGTDFGVTDSPNTRAAFAAAGKGKEFGVSTPTMTRTEEARLAERKAAAEQSGKSSAAVAGGLDSTSLGAFDELSALGDAAGDALQGRGFDYQGNLNANREFLHGVENAHPGYYLGGQIVGGLVLPTFGDMKTVANMAKTGAVEGGVYGFNAGDGSLADRAESAAIGAGTGAVLGPVVGKTFEGAVGLGRRVFGRSAAEEAAGAPLEGEVVGEGAGPNMPDGAPPIPEGFVPDEAAMRADEAPSIASEPLRQRDTINVNEPLSPQPGTAEQRAAALATNPEDVLATNSSERAMQAETAAQVAAGETEVAPTYIVKGAESPDGIIVHLFDGDGREIDTFTGKADEIRAKWPDAKVISAAQIRSVKQGAVGPTTHPAAPLSEVAKAGNINLSKIETPEDIDALMRVTSDTFGGFQAERRGVQKWEATQGLADDLGMTPDDLLHRRTGQAFNAEEALAARNLLAASANETRSLAQAAAQGDEAAKASFVKSFLLHAAITEQTSGAAAEAGRALNIYRKVAKAGLGDTEAIRDAMRRLQSGTSPEEIASMIAALPDDPTALNRFARDAIKPRFKDKLMFVWINALLSGPKTHVVNIASNLVTAAMDIPEQAMAAAIGAPRRLLDRNADAVMMSEIGPRFYGTLRGAAEGLASARVAFKSAEAGGKVEAFRPAIQGMAGHIISIPTKALNAEDEFFKAMARRSELAGLAVRKARMEGVKGDALKNRVETLLAHPTDEMLDAAADAALYKTYQRPLGTRMTKIANVINEWQWPKLFIPFMRTPVNLLKYAIERTPAAPFLKEVRDEFAKGGAARDLAVARMTFGTGVGMLVASLASQGKISGNGPADPSAKRALEANGWQPYSFKVGDEWISYRRLDPWATVIGTAADMVEMQSRMTDKQQQDVAALLIGATTKNLASKTWLSGLGDLVDAVTDPQANAKSVLTRLGASMATPTALGQVAQAVDPTFRDTNDPTYLGQLRKKIEARIPGASKDIIPRRDILGNPVIDEGNALDRLISPFDTSKERNDPVAQAIYDSGARFSIPSRKVAGGNLPDDAYDQYQQVSAQYFYDDMSKRLADPEWQTLGRDERAKAIEKLKDRSRKDARADLFGLSH